MKRLVCLLVLGFVLVLPVLGATASAAPPIGPYLQSLAEDRVAVCLSTEASASVSVSLIAPGESPREKSSKDGGTFCAEFDGLKADVSYAYSVRVNGEMLTEGNFLAQSATEHVLVVFGDTRSGDDSFDLAHRRIIKTIQQTQYAEAYIHTGDFVERGDDQHLWRNFFAIEADLLRSMPLYPSIGLSDQPPETIQSFFPLLRGKGYYSFDRGPAHVAVLRLWRSADQPDEETAPEGAQARWLSEDLTEARKRGAKHLFVIMHEPAFDVGGSIPRAVERVFMPLFERHGVTAVFGGAHYFSHKLHHGVQYFTNGGGGAVLETAPPAPGLFRFFSAVHHFLVLEVGYFGARLRAVNAQGEEFYSVTFDESVAKAPGLESPVETLTLGDGNTAPVNLTVFYDPAETPRDTLTAALRDAAKKADTPVLLTLRRMDAPDNRKLWSQSDPSGGPLPLVLLDDARLNGESSLAERLIPLLRARRGLAPATVFPVGRALVGVVVLAGALVLLAFLVRRKKAKAGT